MTNGNETILIVEDEPDAAAQPKRIDASRPESSVRDVFRFMQLPIVCDMFSTNSRRDIPRVRSDSDYTAFHEEPAADMESSRPENLRRWK